MLYAKIFVFIYSCFIAINQISADTQPPEVQTDVQIVSDSIVISEEQLELKKRKEMFRKDMESLGKLKEHWIDPHDMIGMAPQQLQELLSDKNSKTDETSNPKEGNKPTIVDEKDVPALVKEPILAESTVHGSNPRSEPNTVDKNKSLLSCVKARKELKKLCALDLMYVTRWIKKLLSRIEKESFDDPFSVTFVIDATTIETLKEMADGNSFEISNFDEVITNLLSLAIITPQDGFTWYNVYVYYSNIIWLLIWACSICFVTYITHYCFVSRPKSTVFFFFIAVSIFWHWMHLYLKAKATHHAELASMKVPTQCMKHDLGLFEHINEYFKSFFANNDCSKYYEALLIDPFWEVSISVAISEAFAAFVFQPLFAGSRAVNTCIKQLFDGLPVHLTVALIVFFFMVLLVRSNYSIKFLWLILGIEPHQGSRVEDLRRPTLMQNVTGAIQSVVSGIQSATIDSVPAKNINSSESVMPSQSAELRHTLRIENLEDSQAKDLQVSTTVMTSPKNNQHSESDYSHECITERPPLSTNRAIMEKKASSILLPETGQKRQSISESPSEEATNDDYSVYEFETGQGSCDFSANDSDKITDLEVSNLPETLSDSFEILPIPKENNLEDSFRRAGPNCDTSMDLLEELHAGCKFCQ